MYPDWYQSRGLAQILTFDLTIRHRNRSPEEVLRIPRDVVSTLALLISLSRIWICKQEM